MIARRLTWVCCAALVLTACGARSGPQGAGDGAPPAADASADTLPVDAPPAPDAFSSPVEALILVQEVRDASSTAQQGYAFAFLAPPPHPFFQQLKPAGTGCHVYPTDEVGLVQYSAGAIKITGGTYDTTLTPEKQKKPDDWLYSGMMFPDYFKHGTAIKVSAAGAQVPAFSATGTGVGDLQVTFPTPPLRRAAAATVSFTAAPGTVWVVLWGVAAGNKVSGKVVCRGPGSAGKLVLPAAALAALPSSAIGVNLRAGLVSHTRTQINSRLTVHVVAANLITRTLILQ